MMSRAISIAALAVVWMVIGSSRAHAVPILQLYLEGSTYDATSETWVLDSADFSPGDAIRLWTIGNVGAKGTIYDVKLSAVYNSIVGPVDFTITPSTTSGYNGFTDPSTPAAPTYVQTVSNGSSPLLGDGSSLPTHGEYGAGRTWQEFALGNFTLQDSPLADFITTTPVATGSTPVDAQINVYEITVAPGAGSAGFGEDPFEIHFDLYDHVESGTHVKYKFAPFSHDATSGNPPPPPPPPQEAVPEPASALLLAMGSMGFCLIRRRRAEQAA